MSIFKKNSQDATLPQFTYLSGESSALNLLLYLRDAWGLSVLRGYELIDPPRVAEPLPAIADIERVWEAQWAGILTQELGPTDQSKPIIGWNETEAGREGWSLDLFYEWTSRSNERISSRYGRDLSSLPEAVAHEALDQAHGRGLNRTLVLPIRGLFCLNGQDVILISEDARKDKGIYSQALSQWVPSSSTTFKPTELSS